MSDGQLACLIFAMPALLLAALFTVVEGRRQFRLMRPLSKVETRT